VQDRSVPAISVASVDWSGEQRICDETDAPWPLLVPDPVLPVRDVFPAEVPLPVVPPADVAPAELLLLCMPLPLLLLPLPAAALPVALLPALPDRAFVPVVFENVPADDPALLPAAKLPVVLPPAPADREFVPATFENGLTDEMAPPPNWVLFSVLADVPAAPVVVPMLCARAGAVSTADRTRAVVRKRMAIHRTLCRCPRRPDMRAVGTDPTRQIGTGPDDDKTHRGSWQAPVGAANDLGPEWNDRAIPWPCRRPKKHRPRRAGRFKYFVSFAVDRDGPKPTSRRHP
jgi:hypothetical protein